MFSRLFLSFLFVFFAFDNVSRAAINVGKRTGELKVILSSGDVRTYLPGETLPPVPEGAAIEVLSGEAEISTTDISTVQVTAGFQTVMMVPGVIVDIRYDFTNSATIQVLAGDAQVMLTTGSSLSMTAGDAIMVGAEISETRHGVNILEGEVPLTNPEGQTIDLIGTSGN